MSVSAAYPGAASVGTPPSPGDVRAELERILASSDFQGPNKRGALLRYLVEESLAGRGDLLKGFTIASAVFGRDVTFDAQSDPVVRLAARRLRTALDVYYGTTGAQDPLRISIPKGHYRAAFETRDELSADPPVRVAADPEPGDLAGGADTRGGAPRPPAAHGPGASRSIGRGLVLLMSCITVAAGTWTWAMRGGETVAGPRPAVLVVPFEALGTKADDRFLASGITQELITRLMRFPALRLYAVPAGARGVANAHPAVLGRELGVAYVVSGSVASSDSVIRVGVQLADARTGEILWSETYDREVTPGALLAVRGDLAAQVAKAIGQPNGVVGSAMGGRLVSAAIPGVPGRGPRLAAGLGPE